jgi:hypothetical protein
VLTHATLDLPRRALCGTPLGFPAIFLRKTLNVHLM